MADDDDAQETAGPEEILSPSGPRRASYTPPSNDEASREAAASVFNDDAIAAAMAAELAKVASGPIPIITTNPAPEAPDAVEAADAPAAPSVAPAVPEVSVSEDSTDDEIPPYIGAPAPTVPAAYAPPPPGYEPSPPPFEVPTPPEQVAPPESAVTPESSEPVERLRPRRQALADEDLLRTLNENNLSPEATLEVITKLQAQLEQRSREAREYTSWEESKRAEGTPEALAEIAQARAEFTDTAPAAPGLPESSAPFDSSPATTWTFEAEPAHAAPSEPDQPISAFAPESSSAPEPPDLPPTPPALDPEPTVDPDWASRWAPASEAEPVPVAESIPEPQAAPESELAAPSDPTPVPPAGWNVDPIFRFVPSAPTETTALDPEPVEEPATGDPEPGEFVAEPSGGESTSAVEAPFPGVAGEYAPPAAEGPAAELAQAQPFEAVPPPPAPAAWPTYDPSPVEPQVSAGGDAPAGLGQPTEALQQAASDQAAQEPPVAPVVPAMSAWEQALAETSGSAPVTEVYDFGDDTSAHSIDDVHPLDAVETDPVAQPSTDQQPDSEPSLEGTAFADLLAAAPPPTPPAPEPHIGTGTSDGSFDSFGTTPDSSFTRFDQPSAAERDDSIESPFDSLFDPPAPDAPADSFAPPAFLPPPFGDPSTPPPASPPAPSPSIADLAGTDWNAPPPSSTPAPFAPPEAFSPPPPFSPPALVEPPPPTEAPAEFSSQIGVVPSFDAPPPPSGAIPQPVAIPEPPAPFTHPSDTVQPAPFAPDEPNEQQTPSPANFDALLSGPDQAGGEPSAVMPPDAQATEPDQPSDPEPPSGGPIPFGEGVARANATDPASSPTVGIPATSGSFGLVAVSSTGVAVVSETVPMEAVPVSAPLEIPPAASLATTLPVVARPPRVFSVEVSAIEPTLVEQRVGRAARLFWLWFAANSSLVAVAFGGLVFSLGMSLRQAIIAVFIGVAISILPLALTTLAGKRSGQPTMIISRASFGVVGNIVPSIVALISRFFWGAALLWIFGSTAASILITSRAGDGFNRGQLTFMLVVLGFLIAGAIAYFGYALLARVQLVVSVLSAVLVVGFIALTAGSIDLRVALTTGDGSWLLVVSGVVLAFSFVGIAWANSGSDLARYQRPGSSGAGSMAWASLGAALPSFVLIGYGALLAASHPAIAARLASDPMAAIGTLLPAWYPAPLLVATGVSLLCGVSIAIYSGGFALVSAGVRARRPIAAVIAGAVILALAMVLTGSDADFVTLFRDVATTIAVPVAVWIGIFATETMIRRRPFDSDSLARRGGIYRDVRWPNLVAFVVFSIVGLGLISGTVAGLAWEGFLFPVIGVTATGEVANTDLGVIVALLLGLLFPLVAGIPAIRRQETAPTRAE